METGEKGVPVLGIDWHCSDDDFSRLVLRINFAYFLDCEIYPLPLPLDDPLIL